MQWMLENGDAPSEEIFKLNKAMLQAFVFCFHGKMDWSEDYWQIKDEEFLLEASEVFPHTVLRGEGGRNARPLCMDLEGGEWGAARKEKPAVHTQTLFLATWTSILEGRYTRHFLQLAVLLLGWSLQAIHYRKGLHRSDTEIKNLRKCNVTSNKC